MRGAALTAVAVACLATGARADEHTDGKVQTPVPAAAPAEPSGSVSCGSANRGALANGARMPNRGFGWVTPDTWSRRGVRYGTDELVGAIQRAARTVAAQYPGSLLGVADLAKEQGGAVRGHRSHQSGRDADLLYYALDEHGAYFAPDSLMPVYTRHGKAYYSRAPTWQKRIPVRYFDLARNWALVRALITDDVATVSAIFVSRRIKVWLINYAVEAGESPELIHLARHTLAVPRHVQAHDDHMHVRVNCGDDDGKAGRCRNDQAPSRGKGRKWHRRLRCPWIPREPGA